MGEQANGVHFHTVNGVELTVDVKAGMPLLWVLRDVLELTGTKTRLEEKA